MSGKVIGGLLMLQGIALVTIAVATATAWLIDQIRQVEIEPVERDSQAQLEQIQARLAAIERAIARPRAPQGGLSDAPPRG